MKLNTEALAQARDCYASMDKFRRDRDRCKRFSYGDQWGDPITIDGRTCTEGEYLKQLGSYPLKNNLIRRLVRNVIGVYSSQVNEARCLARDPDEHALAATMTTLLRYNGELNRSEALLTRTLEEFLISGVAVHKKWYGTRNGRTDCWTDQVAPAAFFADSFMRDARGWDCKCVGELHDVDFDDLCGMFAADHRSKEALRQIYGPEACGIGHADFGASAERSQGFFRPWRKGACRVVELWRKEHRQRYVCHDPEAGAMMHVDEAGYARKVEAENRRRLREGRPAIAARWVDEEVWRYYFLSPQGHVLASGDTPYAHGGHPYVIKAYPMIDGEVHSFVADVVDQQKYTNRLISLYDWIIRASAKGVLLVPQECVPYGSSPDDISDAWGRFNGVILYKSAVSGKVPQQVVSNSSNAAITELLNLQMKLFEDISGVHGALEGKLTNAAMSAALYGQQTQAAATALLDVLGTFSEFVRDGAYLDVSNIQQFYTPERIRKISGREAALDAVDAESLRNAEFDLSIAPRASTPASRQAENEMLLEIWKSGQITLEQMLDAGHFPFAASLIGTEKSKTANRQEKCGQA